MPNNINYNNKWFKQVEYSATASDKIKLPFTATEFKWIFQATRNNRNRITLYEYNIEESSTMFLFSQNSQSTENRYGRLYNIFPDRPADPISECKDKTAVFSIEFSFPTKAQDQKEYRLQTKNNWLMLHISKLEDEWFEVKMRSPRQIIISDADADEDEKLIKDKPKKEEIHLQFICDGFPGLKKLLSWTKIQGIGKLITNEK